jgi:hypothetical protein
VTLELEQTVIKSERLDRTYCRSTVLCLVEICHWVRALLHLTLMTEMDIETSVYYVHLTRLIAREDFIKSTRRESTKTYSADICFNMSKSPLIHHGLDDRGLISCRGRNFSLHRHVQIASGHNPVSYPIGTGRRGGGEAHHSHQSSAWSCAFCPPYIFTVRCSVRHKETLTFTFTHLQINMKFDLFWHIFRSLLCKTKQ